jgi:hypothetical protein
MEDQKHRVSHDDDDDDDDDDTLIMEDAPLTAVVVTEPVNAKPVTATASSSASATTRPLTWLDWLNGNPTFWTLWGRLLLLGVLAAFAFVAMAVCLSGRTEGWVDVLAMSSTKNYDTAVATYGWYDVHVIVNDVYLRPPDWASAVALWGALLIVTLLVFMATVAYSLYLRRPTLAAFGLCSFVFRVLAVAGLVSWLLFVLNVTTYINTRDFYWQLKGSGLLYMVVYMAILASTHWLDQVVRGGPSNADR